jgi:putative endonuclease
MSKEPCVYILSNRHHTVLYTGVTSDIARRIHEHKEGRGSVFTRRYQLKRLVFVECFPTMLEAIEAEKCIKGRSRAKKIALIEAVNPEWRDLSEDLL